MLNPTDGRFIFLSSEYDGIGVDQLQSEGFVPLPPELHEKLSRSVGHCESGRLSEKSKLLAELRLELASMEQASKMMKRNLRTRKVK